jgi:hypothetical protein
LSTAKPGLLRLVGFPMAPSPLFYAIVIFALPESPDISSSVAKTRSDVLRQC